MNVASRWVSGCALAGLLASGAKADEVADLRREVEALHEEVHALEARQEETSKDGKEGDRTLDVSVHGLVSAGASSEDREGIESLQAGGHDPKREGFNFQQAELYLAGSVDPRLRAETHVFFLEEEVELEEAFFTSTFLPGLLELKAGYYLTEFGSMNQAHPHTWRWVDQPVVIGRFFGPEGSRAPGARLSWTAPLPWAAELLLGAQNGDNETMASFLGEANHAHGDEESDDEESEHGFEETVGGFPEADRDADGLEDLVFTARLGNRFGGAGNTSALLGFSGIFGPNAAGEDTQTAVYGTDLTLTWRPHDRHAGWHFVEWQTEVIRRDYEADDSTIEHEGEQEFIPGDTLQDWGLYSQLVIGIAEDWSAGFRVDYATGDGDGAEGRDIDDLRNDRLRLSPILAYRPSANSRVRLQYNFDDADHLEDGEAHTVWLSLEFLYGADHEHEDGTSCDGHHHH